MRTKKDSTCRGVGVSLPSDMLVQVDRRIAELSPKVRSFSHYIQLLIHWDLQREHSQSKSEAAPFKSAESSEFGLAV